MKLTGSAVEQFLKKSPNYPVLVFGPEEGLVKDRIKQLARSCVADIHDPFWVAQLDAHALTTDPARLHDEIFAGSLLGGKRLVWLVQPPEKLAATFIDLWGKDNNLPCWLLVEGADLPPSSAWRKFFEAHQQCASIACYKEDAANLEKIMRPWFVERGYHIDVDALSYLAILVEGNRQTARTEAEKIMLWLGEEHKNITLDAIQPLITDMRQEQMDDLVRACACGHIGHAQRALNFLRGEGESGIALLRPLLAYFRRLLHARQQIEDGKSPNDVLATIHPRLFFKAKDDFATALKRWPLILLLRAIHKIQAAEALIKSHSSLPESYAQQIILDLALLPQAKNDGSTYPTHRDFGN
ncbi:MAG: DNA polymerase III subunit delta [Alphaproteobacteria bacterium]